MDMYLLLGDDMRDFTRLYPRPNRFIVNMHKLHAEIILLMVRFILETNDSSG